MSLINFIRNFPEIKEKKGRYYLFLGIIFGLSAKDTLTVTNDCLEQDIFKRKILLNKIMISSPEWTQKERELLFDKVYDAKDSLSSYFKKENASIILVSLFPYISKVKQDKVVDYFLQSNYKNNRKRVYKYFLDNWSPSCQKIIERAWKEFKDEEVLRLIIFKMPKEFLLDNLKEILSYFDDNDLVNDFYQKILRNKLYSRLYDDIPLIIKKLKKNDPISFIFIEKNRNGTIDIDWATEIYKKYSQSRFLARWYAEMGLWEKIINNDPDFLSKIKL
jgi:hypothetical protein